MEGKLGLGLNMSQQLVMTPQLQQAIKLLQLSRLELIDQIREELTENPILDEAPDADVRTKEQETPTIDDIAVLEERREQAVHNHEEKRAASESKQEEYWERFLESYANQTPLPSGGGRLSSEELPSLEATLSSRSSLSDHLMDQLRLSNLTDAEMAFAALIVHNLDDNGYLRLRGDAPEKEREKKKKPQEREESSAWDEEERSADGDDDGEEHGKKKKKKADEPLTNLSAAEIAANEQSRARTITLEDLARAAGLHPEDAEEVLRLVQTLDPVGVAARDLRECLLVQAEQFGYDDETIVWRVIDKHLPHIERRNFQAIAKELKCDLEDVYDASKLIGTLEPRPGRNFTTEDPPYVSPDVYVVKTGDDYAVTTNDDGLPKLKINVEQAQALMKDPKAKEFVQNKLASARWFVRSLDQRQRTIVKVTQCIVDKQREFFEKGVEFLRPMILRDVAETVGMHESTISRVTTNKYVHTPRGIFELKYFFNSSIRRMADEDIASESVKQAIKKIISEEDPKNPLSDEAIAKRLEEQSKIIIARRTIAKYREMMGILSSAKRKHYY
ncbi:MAG: RNA polymerase factor sigma-54 [Myxococcales bacterium]|nr:RNA polymerase factor sigma-54 [Myxococcales bacterium]